MDTWEEFRDRMLGDREELTRLAEKYPRLVDALARRIRLHGMDCHLVGMVWVELMERWLEQETHDDGE
jgi:hypothetical protein